MPHHAQTALILECTVPLVLLAGSVISLRRQLSWHACVA